MKIYRRHYCDRQHRGPETFARCVFRRAEWVTGRGPYALLAWCSVLTVTLHQDRQAAEAAKAIIDRSDCGGNCKRNHEIVVLVYQHASNWADEP